MSGMKLQIQLQNKKGLKVKTTDFISEAFHWLPQVMTFPPFQTTLLPLGGQTPNKTKQKKKASESRRTKEIADMFGYFVLSCLGIMVRSSTRGQIRAKSVKGRWQRANKSSERRQRESEG